MSEKYTIKLEVFEGPFDLLFHLIEKNKIDIYDIPIALITEQYVEYIEAMQEMDLDIASEFLVMAATLLHIKSRMLLPVTKEESMDENLEDPREQLVQKLIEYKLYKNFVENLKSRDELQQTIYFKIPDIIELPKSSEPQLIGLNPEDLANAFKRILEKTKEEEKHKVAAFSKILHREQVSVAKKVRDIFKRLRDRNTIKFSNLFEDTTSKIEKIATFLAVLELIKLKKVTVEQRNNFEDIIVYKSENIDDNLEIDDID